MSPYNMNPPRTSVKGRRVKSGEQRRPCISKVMVSSLMEISSYLKNVNSVTVNHEFVSGINYIDKLCKWWGNQENK